MKKSFFVLSMIAAVTTLLSALCGVLWTNGGMTRDVTNIYGQQVTLFGDGVYANNSILKVGATKGTDLMLIVASVLLLVLVLALRNKKSSAFLQAGVLCTILYATTCLIMGVSFNRLFLLYVLQFGSSLFAFILAMQRILSKESFTEQVYQKHWKGTGIFLIIGGCSVLMWLFFIMPAVLTGKPLENIEIYTTEPTFILDLAIVLPISLFSGGMLLRKKRIGYQLAPVLLTFLAGVGLCVISQTMMQKSMGIVLSMGQLFGLVISFVVLGIFAVVLNMRLLKFAK